MTFYLTGSVGDASRHLLDTHRIGFLCQPTVNRTMGDWIWAADNGCFNPRTYVGDDGWWAWLTGNVYNRARCLFAVAPDVVGDHAATLDRSLPWLPKIRAASYRAAFVAQDGLTPEETPWSEFDVLFIGGSTDFKLSPTAHTLVIHAKTRGKHVHMGRVNSGRRLRLASAMGCDSADGTYLAFGPDVNTPRLTGWIDDLHERPHLPTEGATTA